jgi:hypothetical protein
MKARIVVAAAALAASLLVIPAALAKTDGPASTPATVVLDWNANANANANAVAAVRIATVVDPVGTAPRALYQTEGELYMSYVQAAVYDAVTKIGHRYAPYHHFSVGAGNASIEAAVIAAAYNTSSTTSAIRAAPSRPSTRRRSRRFPTTRRLHEGSPSAKRPQPTSRRCAPTTGATGPRSRSAPARCSPAYVCGRRRPRCRSRRRRGRRRCAR